MKAKSLYALLGVSIPVIGYRVGESFFTLGLTILLVFAIVSRWLDSREPTVSQFSDFELLMHPFEYMARINLETVDLNSLIYDELDLDVRNWNDQRLDRLVESGELTDALADRIVDLRERLIKKIDERKDAKEILTDPAWLSLIGDARDVYQELVEFRSADNGIVGVSS